MGVNWRSSRRTIPVLVPALLACGIILTPVGVTLLDQLNRVSDDVFCFLFPMRSKVGGWNFVLAEAANNCV